MATIGEMIVKLLADTSNFNASMDEAAAKVTASNDAMAASMASSMQSFRDFDAITKESVKSAEGLAQAQAALQAVQQTGAFTSEELAAKEALIADAMKKVGTETQEASGIVSMFTRNSRTMYSTSALITDAMTGQYSRMRREVAALANETGAFAKAFQIMVGPIGLAIAAVGGFAFAAIEGAENASKLEDALAATGGALGVTNSQITNIRDGLIDADTTVGEATTLVSKLALSGRFLGNSLGDAARAAQGMAELTGESMDRAATAVENLAKDPVKALQKLNDQFHFLTVPEAQEIANLLKIGDEAGAAAAAVRDLANAEGQRIQKSQQAQGHIGSWWSSFKGGLHSMESAAESWGAPKTLEQQLGDVQEEIEKTANMYHATLGFKGGEHVENSGLMGRSAQDQINALLAKREALMKQVADESAKAAQAAKDTAATTKQTNDIIAAAGKVGKRSQLSALEEQFKEQEAARHASYDQMRIDGADYWKAEATNAKNSAAVQAAAWQKYIEAHHQLDEQGLRQRAAAERKANEQQLQSLEQVRNAAKQGSQERIDADLKEVQFAIRAFGQRSAQFSAALRQMEQDSKEFVAKEKALALQGAEGTEEIAEKRIAAARAKLQEKYDAHKITDAQLLQGELKLDDELLAAQLAYLRRKEQLDAGNVVAVLKDQQQITIAQYEADRRRAQDEDRALKQSERRWKQYSQRIAGSVQNAMNSMLFQGQTLKNGLASIAESIAETFIEAVVQKPLAAFIAGEGEKLAAAVGFGAQKTATENAQRATNAAADVADKTAAAARAAGLAGAQGVASFAAAPWPIDMGAPAFGAAMMAEAMSFGAMASAERGWERVPADGMLTELHRDEMVLPKHVADPMRNMARNGGGNAGGAIHIHATDAASFKDFLRRNPGILAGGMRHAAARGHF